MKTSLTVLLAICLALLISCKPTPAVPYEHSGIAFTCPEGWEITSDKHEDNMHFVYMEKKGFNASGLITVSWIDGELEWEEYMDNTIESFEEQPMFKELEFCEPSDTVFNGYVALTINYTFNITTMPHTGKILILGDEEKTISIVMQEADEDTRKNKDGFAAFMESFSFESVDMI